MHPAGLLSAKRLLRESRVYPIAAAWRARLGERHRRRRFEQHLRPSDVFLVGHPKSGNTWMAYMLAILRDRDLDERITLANLKQHVVPIHGSEARVAQHAGLIEPRIFRNEWPVYADLYPRTVYLVRDPRAVMVSMFHMYRVLFGRRATTMDEFVEEYLEHGCIRRWEPRLVRWDRHVEAWLARRESGAQVSFVHFEQMVSDRRLALSRAASFAGIPFDDELLERAVVRGSFRAMRADEDAHGAAAYPGRVGRRGHFVRRGRVASWKDELNPRLVARIEKEFAPTMRAMGYLE